MSDTGREVTSERPTKVFLCSIRNSQTQVVTLECDSILRSVQSFGQPHAHLKLACTSFVIQAWILSQVWRISITATRSLCSVNLSPAITIAMAA